MALVRAMRRSLGLSVLLLVALLVPLLALPGASASELANAGTKRFQEIQREAIDQFRSGSVDQIEAQLIIEKFWAGQLRAAVIDGDVENGSLMENIFKKIEMGEILNYL